MAVLAPVTNAPIPPGLTADQLAAAARGAKYGYAEAYSYVYYFIIPFAALALLCRSEE